MAVGLAQTEVEPSSQCAAQRSIDHPLIPSTACHHPRSFPAISTPVTHTFRCLDGFAPCNVTVRPESAESSFKPVLTKPLRHSNGSLSRDRFKRALEAVAGLWTLSNGDDKASDHSMWRPEVSATARRSTNKGDGRELSHNGICAVPGAARCVVMTYEVSLLTSDAHCGTPDAMTIFPLGRKCTAVDVCTDRTAWTRCDVGDYVTEAIKAFTATPFVVVEMYAQTNCLGLGAAAMVPVDGKCHDAGDLGMHVMVTWLRNEGVQVSQYNGTCQDSRRVRVSKILEKELPSFGCMDQVMMTTYGIHVPSHSFVGADEKDGADHVSSKINVPDHQSSLEDVADDRSERVSTPVSKSTTPSRSQSSTTQTTIIGAAIGVVIVVLAFILWNRRSQRPSNDGSERWRVKNPARDGYTCTSPAVPAVMATVAVSTFFSRDQDLCRLYRPASAIRDQHLLGVGGFCAVWLVKMKDAKLASKRLKEGTATHSQVVSFIKEIKINANLSHPRIVSFVGVAWTSDQDLQALFEYMERGSLFQYLREKRTKCNLWTAEKLQVAIDAAEALAYVHSFFPPIVHHDLKSSNVLLEGNSRAKLSDFGVSRCMSAYSKLRQSVGTALWLAPEVMSQTQRYDERSDIFSFGVLLSELDTHHLPYFDACDSNGDRIPDMTILQLVGAGDLVPSFSNACPRPLKILALRCLAKDPKQRLPAGELAYKLRKLKVTTHDFFRIKSR